MCYRCSGNDDNSGNDGNIGGDGSSGNEGRSGNDSSREDLPNGYYIIVSFLQSPQCRH